MTQSDIINVLSRMKGKPLPTRIIRKKAGLSITSTSRCLRCLVKQNEIKKIYKKEGRFNVSHYFISS